MPHHCLILILFCFTFPSKFVKVKSRKSTLGIRIMMERSSRYQSNMREHILSCLYTIRKHHLRLSFSKWKCQMRAYQSPGVIRRRDPPPKEWNSLRHLKSCYGEQQNIRLTTSIYDIRDSIVVEGGEFPPKLVKKRVIDRSHDEIISHQAWERTRHVTIYRALYLIQLSILKLWTKRWKDCTLYIRKHLRKHFDIWSWKTSQTKLLSMNLERFCHLLQPLIIYKKYCYKSLAWTKWKEYLKWHKLTWKLRFFLRLWRSHTKEMRELRRETLSSLFHAWKLLTSISKNHFLMIMNDICSSNRSRWRLGAAWSAWTRSHRRHETLKNILQSSKLSLLRAWKSWVIIERFPVKPKSSRSPVKSPSTSRSFSLSLTQSSSSCTACETLSMRSPMKMIPRHHKDCKCRTCMTRLSLSSSSSASPMRAIAAGLI